MTPHHFHEDRPRGQRNPDDNSGQRPEGRGRRDPQRMGRSRGDFFRDGSDLDAPRRRHEHGPVRGERGDGPGRGERGLLRGEGAGRGRGDGRRRDRAQRGDVRAAILLLLADQPMHGYQLMHAIAERTNGAWRPSPGAIYPTIAALEDEQLVTVVVDGGRKLVTLTDNGREYLTRNAETITDPFTVITELGGGKNDLRTAIDQLHAAARAVADSGTQAQITSAHTVLEQAKRSLYLILAGVSDTQDQDPA